jgi:hypothetical protein
MKIMIIKFASIVICQSVTRGSHHKDPEIDREIQQHGEDNVHVIYDSDP